MVDYLDSEMARNMTERRDSLNKNYTYTTPVTMVDNDFDNDLQ